MSTLHEDYAYQVCVHLEWNPCIDFQSVQITGDEVAAEARCALIRDMWRGRLRGVQRNVEVWQALLSVRSLVLPMHHDTHTWLKLASLCRKAGRIRYVTTLYIC